jgi:hypothetical protein
MANDAAIEQKHGHLEAELARQGRVGIHVDHRHRWHRCRALQFRELLEHLLAQVTAIAAHHHEAGRKIHQAGCYGLRRWGAMDMAGDLVVVVIDFTCVAMNCTVVGGTSPTAVT